MNDPMSKIIAMATLAISQGKSLQISIVDTPDSCSELKESEKPKLSCLDKQAIKQAVLDAYKNRPCGVMNLIESIHLINES